MDYINVNPEQVVQRYRKEYIDDCKECLSYRDTNKDGQTTVDEYMSSISKGYLSAFTSDPTKYAKVQGLFNNMKKVYQKYAGEDGVLDEYEYIIALNSKENDEIITEFQQIRESMENSYGNYDSDDTSTGSDDKKDEDLLNVRTWLVKLQEASNEVMDLAEKNKDKIDIQYYDKQIKGILKDTFSSTSIDVGEANAGSEEIKETFTSEMDMATLKGVEKIHMSDWN